MARNMSYVGKSRVVQALIIRTRAITMNTQTVSFVATGAGIVGLLAVALFPTFAFATNIVDSTLVAHSIVCDDESYLPNMGDGTGTIITPSTATDFVANSNGHCDFASDWSFEWGTYEVTIPADDHTGVAGGDWNTTGVTDASGKVTETLTYDTHIHSFLWFREVLKSGYIPFTGGVSDDVSAEFYCEDDVYNYDNAEMRWHPKGGETFYCVGFNAKETTQVSNPTPTQVKSQAPTGGRGRCLNCEKKTDAKEETLVAPTIVPDAPVLPPVLFDPNEVVVDDINVADDADAAVFPVGAPNTGFGGSDFSDKVAGFALLMAGIVLVAFGGLIRAFSRV